MLDRYWHGEVERLSPEAPVPIVRVRGTDARLGGAANVARDVVALGAKAGLLTVLGTDEPAAVIRRLLKESGIEDHAAVSDGLGTTVKLRVIGRRQQMLRVDFESEPNSDVLAGQIGLFRELLQKFDLVLLSDYGKGGLKHIEQIIGIARAADKPVLVDPKGDEYSRYAGATIVTPNRAELREVVGRWSDETGPERRAQELRNSLDLQALLLTRSEEGDDSVHGARRMERRGSGAGGVRRHGCRRHRDRRAGSHDGGRALAAGRGDHRQQGRRYRGRQTGHVHRSYSELFESNE